MQDAPPPQTGSVGVNPAVTASRGFGHRLLIFDTSSVVSLRPSSCLSPDPLIPSLFFPRSRPWLLTTTAEGGWNLLLQAGSEGPTLISQTVTHTNSLFLCARGTL